MKVQYLLSPAVEGGREKRGIRLGSAERCLSFGCVSRNTIQLRSMDKDDRSSSIPLSTDLISPDRQTPYDDVILFCFVLFFFPLFIATSASTPRMIDTSVTLLPSFSFFFFVPSTPSFIHLSHVAPSFDAIDGGRRGKKGGKDQQGSCLCA